MGTIKFIAEVTKAENGYVIKLGERIFIATRRYDIADIFEKEGQRVYDAFETTQEQEAVDGDNN